MRSSGELALPSLVTSTTSDPIDPAADSSRLLESLARSIREGRRSTDRDGGAGAPARNPRAGAAALARVREIAARAGFPDLDALGARAAVGPRDGGRKRKRDEGDADAAADGLVERWRRRLGPGARAAGGAGHVAVAAPSSSEEGRAGPDAAPSPASATSQGAAFQGHMRAWLKANWQNPFPNDVTLHRLADHMINLDCIGLSNKDTDRLLVREVCSVEEQRDVAVATERRDIAVAKVTNWLANARSRSWRPVSPSFCPGANRIARPHAALRASLSRRPWRRDAPRPSCSKTASTSTRKLDCGPWTGGTAPRRSAQSGRARGGRPTPRDGADGEGAATGGGPRATRRRWTLRRTFFPGGGARPSHEPGGPSWGFPGGRGTPPRRRVCRNLASGVASSACAAQRRGRRLCWRCGLPAELVGRRSSQGEELVACCLAVEIEGRTFTERY